MKFWRRSPLWPLLAFLAMIFAQAAPVLALECCCAPNVAPKIQTPPPDRHLGCHGHPESAPAAQKTAPDSPTLCPTTTVCQCHENAPAPSSDVVASAFFDGLMGDLPAPAPFLVPPTLATATNRFALQRPPDPLAASFPARAPPTV